MPRWNEQEIGKLRYALERNRGGSIWGMARQLHEKIKNRSVNAVAKKLQELISQSEFTGDEVEIDGEIFPAQIVSGYIVITLPDGSRDFLHHFVWRKYKGEIVKGAHVHHINSCKVDNRIENLMLLTSQDHLRLHSKSKTPPESALLFSFLQEKGLWKSYLIYREDMIKSIIQQ